MFPYIFTFGQSAIYQFIFDHHNISINLDELIIDLDYYDDIFSVEYCHSYFKEPRTTKYLFTCHFTNLDNNKVSLNSILPQGTPYIEIEGYDNINSRISLHNIPLKYRNLTNFWMIYHVNVDKFLLEIRNDNCIWENFFVSNHDDEILHNLVNYLNNNLKYIHLQPNQGHGIHLYMNDKIIFHTYYGYEYEYPVNTYLLQIHSETLDSSIVKN